MNLEIFISSNFILTSYEVAAVAPKLKITNYSETILPLPHKKRIIIIIKNNESIESMKAWIYSYTQTHARPPKETVP